MFAESDFHPQGVMQMDNAREALIRFQQPFQARPQEWLGLPAISHDHS